MEDVVNVGDEVIVEVLGTDEKGLNLSRRNALIKVEASCRRIPSPMRPAACPRRDNNRGGDRRNDQSRRRPPRRDLSKL